MPKKVEYFEKNGIKVEKITAGLYHCNVYTKGGEVYSWGRGMYGVLGNGSNSYELEPALNEDINLVIEENGPITRLDSADEYNCMTMENGTLHCWGKNDRGQLGTGSGIGIELTDCEVLPCFVDLKDDAEDPKLIKNFEMG